MRKFSTLTRGPTGRTRMATALAAVGALVMSGGLVMLGAAPTATATPGDPHKTSVCHRTASDTNPYVFITVDDASLEAHYNNLPGHPAKAWKSDGTFRGVAHKAGELKSDYAAASAEDCVDSSTPPNLQPPDVTANTSSFESSCALGYRSRTGVITKEYVWEDNTDTWVLEPESAWTTVWGDLTAYRPLTDAEFAALNCQPGQPASEVVQLQDERTTCNGVEQRIGTQTTSYVWNAATRTYDKVVGEKVWGEWKVIRELTADEALALECIAGEESVAPKPTHQVKPSRAVAPKPEEKPPVVLGTEAAVPTRVHAGMATLPATGSPTNLLLAQLMVGGGLLLLVAGGWIGLGGRAYGRHRA